MHTITAPTTWSTADVPDQRGRTFVVTGANSGIGLAAATALAAKNAQVVLACRSREKAARAVDFVCTGHPGSAVEPGHLDLTDLASVRTFAAAVRERHPRLHALINNAGVMATPQGRTADGFELQLGTNHLGHFALTGLLLPALLADEQGRIVTVSSLGHRAGRIHFDDLMATRRYRRWPAYFQSKLANLLFTYELQRRLDRGGHAALATAAHPGSTATNLGKEGPLQFRVFSLLHGLLQPATMGALPTLRAATDPGARGGDYFGPAGRGEINGPPVRVRSSAASHDEAVARRLWERSAELTGVDFGLR